MRSLRVVVLGMLVAAPLTACGSGGSGFSTPKSVLDRALQQVRNTATTRAEVQFGRPAEAIAADGGQVARGTYQRASGYGLGNLASVAQLAPHVLGFDPMTASYAVTAGQPPHVGTLVSGLKLAGAPARLQGLGATRSGSTFRFRPDNKISAGDKLSTALPPLAIGFNVVRIDASDLRFGASTASVDETRASGSGLLGYRPMADVASCLGDPLAADLVSDLPRAGGGRLPAGRAPKPTPGLRVVGVGLSGRAGSPAVEQLCVSTDSPAHAEQAADAMRAAVHGGSSLVADEPWTKLLAGAKVDRSGTTVSLTAHPAAGRTVGGVLLQALQQGDLPGVSG